MFGLGGGGGGGGGGGRFSEGSGFCIYAFVAILSKPIFVMFSGLLGSLSIKLLYYTAYFFSKFGPILQPKFFVCCA